MKKRFALVVAIAAALLGLVPTSAVADPNNESMSFDLVMQGPNFGVAPNGDRVTVTCESRGTRCGTFSVHPKSVEATGEFVHTDSSGNVLGGGTWTATQLISFEFYGCGVVTGPDPDIILPPNFCGGALKLRVLLTTPIGTSDGVLTVFCVIGPQAPESHDNPLPPELEEGVTLNIPGVINFNHTDGGMNRYERTS
jgi:hypothetical protein